MDRRRFIINKVDWSKFADDEEEKLIISGLSHLAVSTTETLDADTQCLSINNIQENGITVNVTSPRSMTDQKISKQTIVKNNNNNVLLEQRFGITSFNELPLKPELWKRLKEMNVVVPTKFQSSFLPVFFSKPSRNVIAESHSRSGRTISYILCFLNKVNVHVQKPQVLCLAPLPIQAVHIGELAASMLGTWLDVKIRVAVKGEDVPIDCKLDDHVIIGTPQEVWKWTEKHKLFNLNDIDIFILHDANTLIMDHQELCSSICKSLSKHTRRMAFASSYSAEALKFVENIIPCSEFISVEIDLECFQNIRQYSIDCKNNSHKYLAINKLFSIPVIGQTVILCQTSETAASVMETLVLDGHDACLFTKDMSIYQKLCILDEFCEKKKKIIITTNFHSKEIYVENVDVIVNFDLPVEFVMELARVTFHIDWETYLFRLIHFGSPVVLNLIQTEEDHNLMTQIEKYFGKKTELVAIEKIDKLF